MSKTMLKSIFVGALGVIVALIAVKVADDADIPVLGDLLPRGLFG